MGWIQSFTLIGCGTVVSAIIARVIFGQTGVFGKVEANQSRYAPPDSSKWLSSPWYLYLKQQTPGYKIKTLPDLGRVFCYSQVIVFKSSG